MINEHYLALAEATVILARTRYERSAKAVGSTMEFQSLEQSRREKLFDEAREDIAALGQAGIMVAPSKVVAALIKDGAANMRAAVINSVANHLVSLSQVNLNPPSPSASQAISPFDALG